ncbi:MAG: hypothetical protein JRI83_14025 [Deltaproteobacteria bacterium]|nr:hypothetical protein [Deltaproteobacteria bacterium]
MKSLLKLIWNLLAVFGIVCIMGGVYVAYRAFQSYDLTPRQAALKVAKKAGIQSEALERAISPSPKYAGVPLIGRARQDHPRILYRGLSVRNQLRLRYKQDAGYRKRVDGVLSGRGLMNKVVAWTCAGESYAGSAAIEMLLRSQVTTPRAVGEYGNGLLLALAYDLLGDHPGWTPDRRQRFNLLLRGNLRESLAVLDDDSASLWHGRTQLACSAWVVAVAMDPEGPGDEALRARAQRHFLESLEAIRLSGGWPEGYNYWINNRAFPFALACLAHLNGVEAPKLNRKVLATFSSVGLWMLHGVEPQGRFVLFGDTGPRNDLKDETQRVVDLLALGTGMPIFRDYSRYIQGLRGREGYFHGYRWGIPLFRGPPGLDFGDKERLKDLSVQNGAVPNSAAFGRTGGMGQAFIRSGWGRDDTFISFNAGSSFTHHGHYQAGHFTITKRVPLAITSGTYGGFTSAHRLNYYIRSVAGNCVLVLRPGEKVKPNRFFTVNVADGGQRIVMPTGSAVVSVDDWKNNLHKGRHYEGGRITAFENRDPAFVYVGSDLTGAYNNTEYDDNGKGGRNEDIFVVHDRVAATDPSYTKKWLLHSWGKPQTHSERVLKGVALNGILESRDRYVRLRNGKGVLDLLWILPEKGFIRKVGGPDFRYYVEVDGDDSDLDGVNMVEGANERPWFDGGLWRMEIQPETGRKEDHFLVVMKPGIGKGSTLDFIKPLLGRGIEGIAGRDAVVIFGDKGTLSDPIAYEAGPSDRPILHVIVDLVPGSKVKVRVDRDTRHLTVSSEGVVSFRLGPGPRRRVEVLPH